MYSTPFKHFILPELLPPSHVLVINKRPYSVSLFVLTQLSCDVYGIVAQTVLTENEAYIILALLEAHPDYCPYEVLLAAITDSGVEQTRQTVLKATEALKLDSAMYLKRTLLRCCRSKLEVFGLDIVNVHRLGYTLVSCA